MTHSPAQGVGDLCCKHDTLRIPPILSVDKRVDECFSTPQSPGKGQGLSSSGCAHILISVTKNIDRDTNKRSDVIPMKFIYNDMQGIGLTNSDRITMVHVWCYIACSLYLFQ